MLFRQLMDLESHRYTYLVASRFGGEAVLIDPVSSQEDFYVRLLQALELRLVCVLGTSGAAAVSSGLRRLQARTGCILAMGKETCVSCVDRRFSDGEVLDLEGLKLEALHTPGYLEDSYSFVMDDRVFTGDTLLVGDTGSPEQPGGNARLQYDSLFSKLLRLPGATLLYPGRGLPADNVSTIAEQRLTNPRLQVESADEFVDNCRIPPAKSDVAASKIVTSDIAPRSQLSTSALEDKTGSEPDPSLQQIA